MPDGRCVHAHPPCVPRPSLRTLRARADLMVLALVVALLAGLASFAAGSSGGDPVTRLSALDPGPLSSVHAGFTADAGCSACHAEHAGTPAAWLAAAFTPGDQSGRCLGCHAFAGPERVAHNTVFPGPGAAPPGSPSGASRPLPRPQCTTCHTEHRGERFDIARVEDAACANCHASGVSDFIANHPRFGELFPYEVPNNIQFDHGKHLEQYFDPEGRYMKQGGRDRELAARARERCTTCHVVETASREVSPRPFEEICAGCHADQIRERPLVVLIPDEPTPLMTLVLGLDADADEEAILEAQRALMAEVGEGGLEVLVERLRRLAPDVDPAEALAGLAASVLSAAAEAFSEEDGALEGPESSPWEKGVWHAGEDEDGNQSLRYLPRGHSDPVLVAWTEILRSRLAGAREEGEAETALDALRYLLDPETGAGACGKCHAAGLYPRKDKTLPAGASARTGDWRYTGPSERPFTAYAHSPHINILGPDKSCATCHRLDADVDYGSFFEGWSFREADFRAGFEPIGRDTCARCHRPNKVRYGCLTCHRYHKGPSFKHGFAPLQAAAPPGGAGGAPPGRPPSPPRAEGGDGRRRS